MRTLPSLLAVAVVCTACTSGTVTTPPGLDKFGGVSSATWLVVTTIENGNIDVDESLVLTTTNGFCGKAKKVYQQLADGGTDFYAEYEGLYDEIEEKYGENPDYEAMYAYRNKRMCEIYREYFGELASATSAVIGKNKNTVSVGVRRTVGDDVEYGLAGGTYVTSDRADPYDADADYWYGSLTIGTQNPYKEGERRLREADCDSLGSEYDALYDVLWGGDDPIDDSFPLREGELVLEAKGDKKFKFEITEASVDEAAGLTAKGTATRCDVSVTGYAYLPW